MTFQSLGLSPAVLQALALKDYSEPSPIQAQAIPTLLQGRDLLGIAQTGTGKTAAFVLPSIDRLIASGNYRKPRGCRMLVLAPTRELASQIAVSAKAYAKFTSLTVATVFGGTSIHKNRQDLAKGVDILVATPGRLLDLIDQGCASLGKLEILVLDEADQMMDLGFIHALRRIVAMLPAKRQTLFFSATMPKTIRELADKFLTDPAEVKVTPVATTAERVAQSVTFCNQSEKQALLTMLIKGTQIERALVFTRTKHGADRVVKNLAAAGIPANAIHGNKSQPQRERALAEFRSGRVNILVATDIAARGIDVPGVSHVFNFELPNVAEQYVHRIGRTARAGADGQAIAFCADDERNDLKGIEKLIRQRIEIVPPPPGLAAEAARLKASRPAPSHAEERREARDRAGNGGRGAGHGGRSQGGRPQGGRGGRDDRAQQRGPVGNPARGERPQGEQTARGERTSGGERPANGGERTYAERRVPRAGGNGGSGPNHRTSNGGIRRGEVGRHRGSVKRTGGGGDARA